MQPAASSEDARVSASSTAGDSGSSSKNHASDTDHHIVSIKEDRPAHKFPWKGSILDRARKWPLTPTFQAAIQLCLGTLLLQLFVFNSRLKFTQSCLATVFFVAGMLLVAPDCHVGGRFIASVLIVGPTWFGALVASCVISLGRAPGVAYTTFLILFLAFGVFVLTVLRVKGNLGLGIISNLSFGITLIAGQFLWGAKKLWGEALIRVLKIGLLASFGVIISGLFVLPTLAGDDLRMTLAGAIKDLGHVVSEQAGHLLLRAEDEERLEKSIGGKAETASRAALARASVFGELEVVEGETDEENVERLSNPKQDLRPRWMTEKSAVTVADIRPRLQRCRQLFQNACVEPNFLRLGIPKLNTHKWPAVMNALDSLTMRVSALDSLIEGDDPLFLDSECIKSIGVSVLPAYRLLFAQLAAALATAARSIKAEADGRSHQGEALLAMPAWALVEYDLAKAMYAGLKRFWAGMRHKAAAGQDFLMPPVELRAVFYMGTIGSAIMEAVVNLELALQDALLNAKHQHHAKVVGPVKEAIAVLASAGDHSLLTPPPDDIPAVQNILIDREMNQDVSAKQLELQSEPGKTDDSSLHRDLRASFHRTLEARPFQKKKTEEFVRPAEGQSNPPTISKTSTGEGIKQSQKMGLKQQLINHFGWMRPLVRTLFAWDILLIISEFFIKDLPQAFSSRQNLYNAIWRNRWFQFSLKFYFASLIILGALMAIQMDYPWSRSWNGLYIDMTVVVVLSEKVDTTFQKGMVRIVTTCLGAVVGFVVMVNTSVASSSYGLAVITCFMAFASGLFSLMPSLKYALFLFLITLDSVILCQYDGRHHGSTHNFYTRLIVTVWGVILCIIFDLLMPWYTSSAALEQLGGSVKSCGEILKALNDIWFEETELAAGGFESQEEVKAGIQRMETNILQKKLAGPLAAVQASVAREGVLWKQGTLAMPRIVGQVMGLLQEVLEKFAALELMLLQKPIISGRYSGTIFKVFTQPLQEAIYEAGESVEELCAASALVLGEYPTIKDMERLQAAIPRMIDARLKFRRTQRERLQVYVSLIVKGGDPRLEGRTSDDGIRYQSVIFAFAKTFDKLTKLARTLADDPWLQLRCSHPHSWRTWRTWTGQYGYTKQSSKP